MKKFDFNRVLFVFAMIFIITGLGIHCFKRLGRTAFDVLAAAAQGKICSAEEFTENVDTITNKELSYHSVLMDIDSVRNNLLGTRVIIKDGSTIIKTDDGSLIGAFGKIDDEDIEGVVSSIKELETVAEENGAAFLYCAAPRKEYFEDTPGNITSAFHDNFDRFLRELHSECKQQCCLPVITSKRTQK